MKIFVENAMPVDTCAVLKTFDREYLISNGHADIVLESDKGAKARQSLPISTINAGYGIRPVCLCPACGQKRYKLFMTAYSSELMCRNCHGLVYEHLYRLKDQYYLDVIEPLRRLRKIELKLGRKWLRQGKRAMLEEKRDGLKAQMRENLI